MLTVTNASGFGSKVTPDPSLPAIADTLFGHFRADLGVTKDGSNLVNVWADQSGNGNNLVQVTSSYQPLWVADGINGKPTVYGAATDNFMTSTFSKAQPFHTFLITKAISYPSSSRNLLGHIYNDSHPGFLSQTSQSPYVYQNAGIATGNRVSMTLGTAFLLHGYWSGSSSYLVLDDGAQQGATNPGTAAGTGFNLFGTSGTTTYNYNAHMAEIVMYETEVTGSALATLEDYFNTRYTLGFS